MEDHMPTILLVEDQPSVRLILSAGLKAHGFQVMTAGTGEKALAFCEGLEGPLDLLITDVGLSAPQQWTSAGTALAVVHGLALARAAVKVRPSLKVILLTGHSDETLQRLGGKGGLGFPLLRKPCDVSVLVQTVREVLSTNDRT